MGVGRGNGWRFTAADAAVPYWFNSWNWWCCWGAPRGCCESGAAAAKYWFAECGPCVCGTAVYGMDMDGPKFGWSEDSRELPVRSPVTLPCIGLNKKEMNSDSEIYLIPYVRNTRE